MTSGERMVWAAEFVRMMAHERLQELVDRGIDPTAAAVTAANRATLLVARLRLVAEEPGLSRDTPEALADMLGVRT